MAPAPVQPDTPVVAIFLQDLSGGGAERMMLNLAGAVVQLGVQVDLVLVRTEGAYLTEVPQSVRVVSLGGKRTLSAVPALIRYLARRRPNAVLSALVHVNIAALIAKLVLRRRTRVVVSERNTISIDAAANTGWAVRLAHRLVPYLYPLADGVIAVSKGVSCDLARYAGLPQERITVVNNPVVTERTKELGTQQADHPWLGHGAPPFLLSVGRLHAQKDFDTLLKAFARVRRDRPLRLMVLGEGGERDHLESLARCLGIGDDVEFPGFHRNPYAFMAKAAALVLSSRWEGSPNVLVEAMALGTPVVSTDCPSGPREILDAGRLGPLVPVEDPERLASAIVAVLDDPPSADDLKARAADYEAGRVAQQYLNILLGRD